MTENDESMHYETRELTEENIPEIAKRSGQPISQLEMLRGAMDAMGRKPQVRYRVIPEVRSMDRMDEMKDKVEEAFKEMGVNDGEETQPGTDA